MEMGGSPVTAQDPLRTPLRVVAAGLGATVLMMTLSVASFALFDSGYRMAALSNLISVVSVVSDTTVVVGCVMLARLKRPGSSQALASAICHGIGIAFVGLWYALAATGFSSLFTLMALANNLIDVAGVITLALALREVAKSRGRNYDGLLFAAAGVMGFSVLGALVNAIGSFPMAIYYMTTATSSFSRLAMIFVALMIVRHAPLPDAQLAYDSAYRGPTGAVESRTTTRVEGSVALGFMAGFFGGCIGALLVLAIAKGVKTKRGAGIGFACQTVVGIGLRAAMH